MGLNITEFLKRDNNNITIVRLMLASMVIMGHTWAINPVAQHVDLISSLAPFESTGSVAVKVFFFLSGLLIVNSLMIRNNSIHYWSHRFLRIFPALIVLVFITAFLIGPVFTEFNITAYFIDKEPYKYVLKNILLNTRYSLPGVFLHHPHPNSVNGSLWSLAWEFRCYIATYLIYLLSFKKYFKWVAAVCFVLLIIQVVYFRYFMWYDLSWDPLYPLFYFAGGLVALFSDKIYLNIKLMGILIAVMFLGYFLGYPYNSVFFCLFVSVFLLWLCGTKWVINIKLKDDISYGVYLWGFIVQQCIHACFPNFGSYTHMIIALIISFILGAVSWFTIEKPSMSLAKKISKSTFAKSIRF